MTRSSVRVVRVYDQDAGRGGYRVLVDRLWPRGIRKDDLRYDEWARDLAPSSALRKWYGHEPSRFAEFSRRYRAELESGPPADALAALRRAAADRPLILLTATKDVAHSGAEVLRSVLSGS